MVNPLEINNNELNLNNQMFLIDDRDRAMNEYAIPTLNGLNPSIIRPNIQANQFELNSMMFQMLQTIGQFNGLPTKDPHFHLRLFIKVVDSFKFNGVIDETFRLRLFPYSLRDCDQAWLNFLPPNSITTWNGLAEKFLMKYFPPIKNEKLRNDITSYNNMKVNIYMKHRKDSTNCEGSVLTMESLIRSKWRL